MILREVVDTLIRSVSGGTNTIDNKYEPRYVEALLPQLREQALKVVYYGDKNTGATRRIDYAYAQNITIQVDTGLDPDLDYVTFTCPKPIAIGRMVDGLLYVGKKNSATSFSKMLNREDIANAKMRGMFNGSVIAYIWEEGKLEVYGNKMLKELNVRAAFSDPTQVPNFNIQTSAYPVTDSLLMIMTDLFKANQNINIQKPADPIMDGADTTSRGIISQNLKA
jgi:hypothetical protein